MKKLLFFFTLLFSMNAFAQKSVSELLPAHAAALQEYLAAHKNNGFRQEYVLDEEFLKAMRKYRSKGFKPNYITGDFNRDRIKDFAVLMTREGEPVKNDSGTETHNPDYPLTLVIFNGLKKGGFRVAYNIDLMGPAAAFIDYYQRSFFYGVFESDAYTFGLAPAGKGYIMEFEKPR